MKKGYESEYEKLGKQLLSGKKIGEITLRGKKYKFDYTKEEFIETALKNGWDDSFVLECANDYENRKRKYEEEIVLEDGTVSITEKYVSIQSDFISDFSSDFCLNSGGFGCIEGKTKIQTPGGEIAIEDLYKNNIAPFVYSYVNGKVKIARATIPIKYKKAQLFKVKYGDKEIIATAKHRFLTKKGWKKLSDLSIGEEILGYVPFLQESISDSVQSILLSNVFHLIRKVLGFLNGYRSLSRSYDEPLQSATNICQGITPSQDDVHEHNHQNYNKDADYSLLKYNQTYQQSFHLSRNNSEILFPSSQNPLVLNGEGYTLKSTFEYIYKTFQLSLKSLWNSSCHHIKVLINHSSFFSSYPNPTITKNKIQSITTYCVDNYYDLHVFGTNNYLAEGVFHHNSGKSLALYVKLILLCKCFPGNRVLLGRKTLSDIDRAVLPELFDLMPPTWYEYRVKDGLINFNNGSQIILFGLDAMQSGSVADIKKAQQKLKSLNLGAYFIDQLEEVEYEVFEVLNSRLRRNEVPFRQGNMDCNPANFWAYHQFKKKEMWNGESWVPAENNKSTLFESSMLHNPNLPGDYIRKQRSMGKDYYDRFVLGLWNTSTLLKGSVFAKEHRDFLRKLCKPPVATEEGCKIWEQPKNGYEYRIGVDPSEGIVDPSSITVVDNYGHKVAKFNGMITIQGLADKVKYLYYKYKKPLIIPECNNSGTALIREIRDLNIYRRKNMEEKWDKQTEKLGFRTSWQTKQILISHFQELLRNKAIRIYDENTVEEMNTFLWNDDATQKGAGAGKGFHDDDIMSTMLAFFEWTPQKRDEILAAESKPRMMKKFQYA